MNINYSSPVRLTLALLPQMLERGEGRIVNVSSVAATLSPPGEAAYAATKAAMTVFSESMAVDLWDTGVKVTVIYPGVVDTELFTLPDNDPFMAQVESIPVEEAVTTILAGAGGRGGPGLRAGVVRRRRLGQGRRRGGVPGRHGRVRAPAGHEHLGRRAGRHVRARPHAGRQRMLAIAAMMRPSTSSDPARRVCTKATAANHSGHTGNPAGARRAWAR